MHIKFIATTVATVVLTAAGCGSRSGPIERATSSGSGQAAPLAGSPLPGQEIGSVSRDIILPAGSIVRIRTNATLSTKQVRTGEVFGATLADPLVVGGTVVVQRGTAATLLIADSDPGGRVKGVARLGVRLTALQAAGSSVPLETDIAWHQAHATKRKDAAKIGILSGVGAAIGAIAGGGKGAAIGAGAGGGAGTALVLSTHGDAAVVPAESVLSFRLTRPMTVTVRS